MLRGSEDRRIGGSEDRRIGGSEDRRIGGSEDRRIGGSEDRRIGGSEDRRIAGSQDRTAPAIWDNPGRDHADTLPDDVAVLRALVLTHGRSATPSGPRMGG